MAGETRIIKSACGMCHGGCGVLVHVIDGRVVKIEGNPESPLSKGTLCVKCKASIENLYHPNRLKYPLKRIGKRGEGKWQRMGWDEALSEISAKMQEIKSTFGSRSVAIGQGTGRHHYEQVIEFAHQFGTPNWTEPGLAQCFLPRSAASILTLGANTICDYYGQVNPKCILVWGHNPLNSGSDGELAFNFLKCVGKGARVISVDPRKSETARISDFWLQLRPGTDCALALAMIHTIIYEKLYDFEFVENWTTGFEKLKKHVKEFTPQWAEEITWVDSELIRSAAIDYATLKPSCLDWGVAIEQTPNSLQTARAVAILRAITGNLDAPGGDIFGRNPVAGFPRFWDSQKNLTEKPLGDYKYLGAAHFPTLLNAIETGKPYPIKCFLIFGNNAVVTYADSKKVYDGLKKLDFLVVCDIYMTPTAELADIVLPAATWLEFDGLLNVPFAYPRAILARRKAVSFEECLSDEEIIIRLARKLNLPLGRVDMGSLLDYRLSDLEISFNNLALEGHLEIDSKYKKYLSEGFSTPSGKVELYSSTLEKQGFDPMPVYKEPPESPLSRPDIAKDYPLILTTGGRILEFFHSEGRQLKSLRDRHPQPLVEINTKTAFEKGIAEGDRVEIETPRGKITQVAKLSDGIHPRVIHIEHGWWFPEEGSSEHGLWKSNANVLTSQSPPYDTAIGTYQLRALLCRIKKS